MEYKDTVMSEKKLYTLWKQHDFYDMKQLMRISAEAQAEISFKAGVEYGADLCAGYMELTKEESHKAGIREVMGWLHSPCPHTGGLEEEQMYAEGCPKCWQAKLKDWGL